MIVTRKGFFLIVIFFSLFFVKAWAKDIEDLEASSISSVVQINRLKVFVEGSNLDFDYIRRNINFVDFVNDPKGSDVHIIVTQNQTGSGGINYILNFYSLNLGQIGDISLNCISNPGDTDDEKRECITRSLKLGLMPYVNETTNGDMIDILYTYSQGNDVETAEVEDAWEKWVYRMDANGGFNLEESITRYNYSFNIRVDKVTDEIKFRSSYFMRNRFEEIETEGEILESVNVYKYGKVEGVYSLSKRWSVGLFNSFFQSTYWNTQYSFDFKPAIEYNFFPWEDSDKRIFTISYFAGIELKKYYETTIFGKDTDNLYAQNLKVNFELVQPWGEIETRLEGGSYFHDFSKNRISFESDLSFRIVRGLSLNFEFRAENIHNQLYLPAGEVSLADILMGNQKLPSTFEISGGMGIRIQFGSLYNNIVNNRL